MVASARNGATFASELDAGSAGMCSTSALLKPHTKFEEEPLGPSPLSVLQLRREELITSWLGNMIFDTNVRFWRAVPALVIYGGTISLLVCVFFKYRWGVLLMLMLYSWFMFFSSWNMVIFGMVGVIRIWLAGKTDWYVMYCRETERAGNRPYSIEDQEHEQMVPGGALKWQDVIHLVFVPNYKTPLEVLRCTIRALELSSQASQLVVCLACEERDESARRTVAALQEEFAGRFWAITATFHPANIPGHIKGKASNMNYAYPTLLVELRDKYKLTEVDNYRLIATVIDDDSEMHEAYFEALTYHFLSAGERERHLTVWQCPVCHFKNYLTQPLFVRCASLFASLHELSCLANPLDQHVPFSTYSLSAVLCTAVGGWDPDWLAEDWHMMGKCAMKTEGRTRCQGIYLPLINYAPEESSYWGTMQARWTQAKRHALGVSEVIYMASAVTLAMYELPTMMRRIRMLWRVAPVAAKFCFVHFEVSTLAIWPVLAQVLVHYGPALWHSWCMMTDFDELKETSCMHSASDLGYTHDQIIQNSWMVSLQQRGQLGLVTGLIFSGGVCAFYLELMRDRVAGDMRASVFTRSMLALWLKFEFDVIRGVYVCSLFFGSLPEWYAVVRILFDLSQDHTVAAMVGREGDQEDV